MALPKKQKGGNELGAAWLNELRAEVRANRLNPGPGIRSFRNPTGTTISATVFSSIQRFQGAEILVLNKTGRDLFLGMVAGIERTTLDDGAVADSIAEGIEYILRKPVEGDESVGYVIITDEIENNAVGRAYVDSVGFLAQIRYDSELDRDFEFAKLEIDPDATASLDDKWFQLVASKFGSAKIIQANDADEQGQTFTFALINFPLGGSQGVINNPQDLTYTGEHSEAASTNFYTNKDGVDVMIDLREPPDGTKGFIITQSTGSGYFDAGDSILYGYVADFHYDSIGALLFIEKERRVIIDTPEDCS